MASKPPGKCCASGIAHTDEPIGKIEDFLGVQSYVTGEQHINEKVIVIATDIYGLCLKNTKLVADKLAAGGYAVLIPDILFDDPYPTLNASEALPDWLAKHPMDKVDELVIKYVKDLKAEYSPNFIGSIGYCFGAKPAIHLIDTKFALVDACAIAHPSFVSMEELEAIGKNPILISAAENDPIFSEESRHATEAKLKEIGANYVMDLFGGVEHGFAVRGDLSIPAVKYAREKTIVDQLFFFDHYCSKK
ncbi:hypothetical protein TPHA_0H03000 [Tetrapisispora phaffii CBS 4417]|uniref:Dienelactone hydrolase domain-containing protein n=1 Tax=Tetrapisispora phaffii (strain ATCC 24235 / CBS 4417 / NBRC 1672 / NRRL Y-8282 / UCD 70-5) TaxID=1071381 RepID=G8BWQ2_TETPH|nr:hypothetical protein TPHA_0H03000 [Tetrapisispora phaffii CBS 4417]CCE64503.1 hypothetical protein TPHA_0H03000 [Tetrapisispora phaffii CBS 4417]